MNLYDIQNQLSELQSEVQQLRLKNLKLTERNQRLLGIAQDLAADLQELGSESCDCEGNWESISPYTCPMCRLGKVEAEIIKEATK